MSLPSLLHYLSFSGINLELKGENIRVYYNDIIPSTVILQEIRINKLKLITTLRNDKEVKEAGFIVGIPGILYTLTLDKYNILYIEKTDDKWESRVETYQKERKKVVKIKLIDTGNTFDFVLYKTKRYLNRILQKA
ncbi:hypothetical protein [Priestia aryabhattai]|uniref:hypothetical protein n=1 Tax=Priestia aryabhattai TaxID=412384 RepID=UPI001ADB95AB|nr:hypothetical protein [Priestia aryabhattai]QTL47324.1 hypothetical protein J5Z55_14595 [Priestia aryabhattai]